jgi:hypothetical protein
MLCSWQRPIQKILSVVQCGLKDASVCCLISVWNWHETILASNNLSRSIKKTVTGRFTSIRETKAIIIGCFIGKVKLKKAHVINNQEFNSNICYLSSVLWKNVSRGSSGSIVSDYRLDDRAIGVWSPAGAKDFSSSLGVQTGSGAHPASCTMGTGGPFPRGKARPGHDADHSPPSSAEVENE